MTKSFVFDQITDLKRRQTLRKLYFRTDLSIVTSNLVNKGKQVAKSHSSDAKFTLTKRTVYRVRGYVSMHSNQERSCHTVGNKWLAGGSDDEEDRHSATLSSFSSNSNKDSEAMLNMADLSRRSLKKT